MANPFFSIVLPAFNAGPSLETSIASALAQTFNDLEVVVIDDGSVDDTRARAAQWSRRDSRVRVVGLDENVGITKALNAGLAEARGEWIARLDADDFALPNRLTVQHRHLEQHDFEHGLYGSRAMTFELETGRCFTMGSLQSGITDAVSRENAYNPIVHSTLCMPNTAAFRYRDKFALAQDFDLVLRCATRGTPIRTAPEVLVARTLHAGAVSEKRGRMQHAMAVLALDLKRKRELSSDDGYDDLDVEQWLTANAARIDAACLRTSTRDLMRREPNPRIRLEAALKLAIVEKRPNRFLLDALRPLDT